MSIEKRNFTPSAQNPQWYKLSLILPSIYNNSMSVIEAFQPMLDCINDVNQNFNELVDWTNTRDDELVDYLNQQLEDFTNANNEFYQKIDNLVQQFMEDVNADIEAFKTEIKQIVEDYKNYLDQKYQEFTEHMTGEFNALKQSFEELKAKVEKFMTDMTAAFEAFKQKIMELIKGLQDEVANWQEEWEQYKLQIKAYVDGLFDGLEQFIKDNLETIVKKLLKEVFGETAGICLGYDADSNTINLLYDEHFARDDQNRLTLVSGAGGGGDSIEAGQGISLTDNPENHKKIVSVKLAANGGLEFDESGALKSTGGGSGGGDTIVPGQAIEITGEENVKTINAKIATKDTVGVVKTGDPLVTGITIAADGTISKYKWSAVDVTDDQEIFDSNMENANPWTVDCKYNPEDLQATLYIKLSAQTLTELGLPTNVQITEWAANPSLDYETVPVVSSVSTNDLIGQANCKVTLSSNISGHRVRNGSGNLVFTWTGKENVIKVPFTVTHANMELDETNPIKIDGQAIGSFGTYTFTTLTDKNIVFVMKDGTEVSNIGKLCYSAVTATQIDIVSENKSCSIQNRESPLLQQKNIVDGIVELKMKPAEFGMSNNDALQTVLQFYVKYNSAIWDTFKVVSQQEDYNMDNYTSNLSLTLEFPGYHGDKFVITSDNPSLIGIGGYLVASKNVGANTAVTIFAARYGTAQVSITTSYVTTFIKTLDFTVTETNNQPHFAVTTNSTLVGDTGLDIANPKLDNSSYQFSKAQGVITFWIKSDPLNNLFAFINRGSGFKIQASSGQVIARCETNDFNVIVNDTKTYDFSTLEVGTEIFAEFDGNAQIGAYRVKIGQVVN